jgi:hypothetical protein
MARGEDTSKHPNRQVGRGNIPPMSDEQKQRLYGGIKPNFPLPDSAPAGGIQRPEMESCAGCGENTPKGSGSCADCK